MLCSRCVVYWVRLQLYSGFVFCKAFAAGGVLRLCVTLTFFTSKGEWCDTKRGVSVSHLMETQGQQQNLWRGNDHGCIF